MSKSSYQALDRLWKAERFSVIATASGDGLVYEVINGLAVRPDARKALQIPIAPIPTGPSPISRSIVDFADDCVKDQQTPCVSISSVSKIPLISLYPA